MKFVTRSHFFNSQYIHLGRSYLRKKRTIIRNSKKEVNFISELMNIIGNIDISSIPDKESLETMVQDYVRIFESIQYKFS